MAYPDQSPSSSGFPVDETNDGQDSKKEAAQRVASDAGDRARNVADKAQQEAADVAATAKAAGSDVADTAQEEVGNVAHEAGRQSRRVLDEGLSELQSQAGAGQQRLAEMARAYGSELQSMTKNSDDSGPVTDLAHSAQRMFDDAANWLERTEPSDVLDSVRRYASRNPWQFLAISAGVGFVGARIVRGLKNSNDAHQPTPISGGSAGHQSQQARSLTTGGAPGTMPSTPAYNTVGQDSVGYDADGYPRTMGMPPAGLGNDPGMAPGVGMPVDPYPRGGGAGGL